MRVASINVEAHKHLELVRQFLAEHKPEIVFLQEVFAQDMNFFAGDQYSFQYHSPNCEVVEKNRYGIEPLGLWGIGVLAQEPVESYQALTYKGEPNQIPHFVDGEPNSTNRTVQVVKLKQGGEQYAFANTHFTWTPNGNPSPEQERDIEALLAVLRPLNPDLLVGDFNAPRGKATFARITEEFTDNIPPEVTTTIDGSMHYAGNLQLVVDGIFSKPTIEVKNVQVLTGVSDHCALLFDIS